MSDALPAIGAHCALPSCNLNDFLPIRCPCGRLFCRDHVAPDKHACPVAADRTAALGGERSTPAREKCAKEGCARPSLESAVRDEGRGEDARTAARCAGCGGGFCAYHRDPSSHSCSPTTPAPPPKNQTARDLLAKNFPTTPSSSSAKPAARAKKPANKQIALMQIRRRAQPADPKDDRPSVNVPVGERLHVELELEGGLPGAPSTGGQIVYWFRKNIATGRALDVLAGRMGVSTTNPLQLSKISASGDTIALRNDAPLADQVEDADVIRLARRT
ncbi:uncharacterized protein C8Q71DRAFT_856735 [Rhodofomes roseus]|uniref:AN1-type domain-containing protein n=1 Tax=Rhodofomes roseus TaxID=34475 RepID=A0ABQ8KJ45_9APHY|nr:uncharacterized protein C8Q71DRAFT_856735 [Rhodofomes roseus]KAH9837534.1 hypothetical protein C8Q71DRAFT_856735 [Rhodofomes roseus]